MTIERVQKKIDWTPEKRLRHKAIRETFKDRPSIDELVACGELSGQPMTLDAYLNRRLNNSTAVSAYSCASAS